eukprot:2473732-Rhodomonas_salina.2
MPCIHSGPRKVQPKRGCSVYCERIAVACGYGTTTNQRQFTNSFLTLANSSIRTTAKRHVQSTKEQHYQQGGLCPDDTIVVNLSRCLGSTGDKAHTGRCESALCESVIDSKIHDRSWRLGRHQSGLVSCGVPAARPGESGTRLPGVPGYRVHCTRTGRAAQAVHWAVVKTDNSSRNPGILSL